MSCSSAMDEKLKKKRILESWVDEADFDRSRQAFISVLPSSLQLALTSEPQQNQPHLVTGGWQLNCCDRIHAQPLIRGSFQRDREGRMREMLTSVCQTVCKCGWRLRSRRVTTFQQGCCDGSALLGCAAKAPVSGVSYLAAGNTWIETKTLN